jgi:glyoxylase-like metal-dependent hydrolase (beta-lactamase superfamily II)
VTTLMNDQSQDWWEPGAFEVVPGVHRIPLPLPGDALKAVNVYAVQDGDRAVLIDGGWSMAGNLELLTQGLAAAGLELGDVHDVFVTHSHRDHYTLAVAIRRAAGSQVSLGAEERHGLELVHRVADLPTEETMRPGGIGRQMMHLDLLDANGAHDLVRELLALTAQAPPLDLTDWELPDTWLADGTALGLAGRTLTALHTPGHTRGHMVFHDAGHDLLFAGDHVLPHITPSIGLEVSQKSLVLGDYLTSLALVRDLPDAVLLPAHGPATASVHERVDELLEHHRVRLDASLAAIESGASTGFEVAQILRWTRRGRHLDELDPFNTMLAVMETGAHLDVLAERGRLVRTVQDGVVHYTV